MIAVREPSDWEVVDHRSVKHCLVRDCGCARGRLTVLAIR